MVPSFVTLLLAADPGSIAGSAVGAAATLKSAIEDFEFGEHGRAAEKLTVILNPIQLDSAEDVIVARQYLGACFYLLEQRPRAEAEFSKILALDPEHKLDPEVFSPALVQFFEEVRARTGLSLRKPPPEPPPKAPLQPPPPSVIAPRPERDPPPMALALVPFGVGQFNNDHPVRGTLFAAAEGGLFGTALATFVMFNSLKIGEGRSGEAIFASEEDADQARTLQSVYLATFYVGLGVLALGVVEALVSYPGDATTVSGAGSEGPAWVRF